MYTTNLVVKVASRCNLNCTYCYVYNMGDNSYKLQPKFMSIETIKKIIVGTLQRGENIEDSYEYLKTKHNLKETEKD